MTWWKRPRDLDEVALSRVLRALLLGGFDSNGTTLLSMGEARTQAGVDRISARHVVHRFVDDDAGLFRKFGLEGGDGTGQQLTVTGGGRQEADHFRAAAGGAARRQVARARLLLWLDGQPNGRGRPAEMSSSPLSWFYGNQLTHEELSQAGKYLEKIGLIKAMFAAGDYLVIALLEPGGYRCLEQFGGDVTAMQNRHAPDVHIEHVTNQGNLIIAGTGGSQMVSMPGAYLLTAGDIAQVLNAIAAHPTVAAAAGQDLGTAADFDHIAGAGDLDPTAVSRAAETFRAAARSLPGEPVAAAALTALANVLASRTEGAIA